MYDDSANFIWKYVVKKGAQFFQLGRTVSMIPPIPDKKKEVADVLFFPSPSDEKENGFTESIKL